MERKQCRLWWPENLTFCAPNSDLFLFGWSICSANAVDVVVASVVPSETMLHHLGKTKLEEILCSVDENMPVQLQDLSFSIIGFCTTDYPPRQNSDHILRHNEDVQCTGTEENSRTKVLALDSRSKIQDQESSDKIFKMRCRCEKLDQLIQPHRQSLMNSGSWMLLLNMSQIISFKKMKWIPQVDHIHLNEHVLSSCDVHLIIYELPSYGVSHLSLDSWGFPEYVSSTMKKPKWVNELEKRPLFFDLESVILTLNCASSAMGILGQRKDRNGSASKLLSLSMLVSIVWLVVAVFLASISTLIFVVLQLFYKFWGHISRSFFFVPKIFIHTCKNVHIRSCQFLYWPVFLQDIALSSNVEYLHRTVLRKHFIWSNLVMDTIFGVVVGVLLLANVEALCVWVSVVIHDVTDNLLRSGCVWLMGVPAGFKLNNELALCLGTISLNAIQIFSTLWFILGISLRFFIQVLAVSGILFGLSVPAALCIDGLKLATFHVSSLHWLISILYSLQIQALASLWRLFRGRKVNPLRQRLDNYDYTVEQHVVGSLLFTPLLLLLPTTSVFYIYFTCLCTTIALTCFIFEIAISILHATPYAAILLWIIKRKRFPSGVWFKIVCPDEILDGSYPETSFDRKKFCFTSGEQVTLISFICSNYATLGEVIGPHYRNIFRGVDPSFIMSMAHGMLSGRRFPYTLHTYLPPTMPWIYMSFRAYWKLCYAAVRSNCS